MNKEEKLEEYIKKLQKSVEKYNIKSTSSIMENKINIEDIKKATDSIIKMEEPDLPKTMSWFTKLMAKFGWHRKYEIMVFDKSKLFTYRHKVRIEGLPRSYKASFKK